MSALDALLVVLAGIGAGTINTIVGSGTLITFPTLLLLGIPPITANISNNIGLVPGSLTGSIGYRKELVGRRRPRSGGWRRCPSLGAVVGAVLLLVLDPTLFRAIVPVLILLGLVLVVTGPRLNAWAERRRAEGTASAATHERAMQGGVFGAGVYGGYFGAAQGIILMGVLGALSSEPIQRLNGYKNVLATIVNGVAALGLHPRRARPDRLAGGAAHRDRLDHRRRARLHGRAPPAAAGAAGRHRRDRPRGDRQARRVPLMDWPLVLALGLAVLAGGVVQSTIGFGLAVVAAPFVVLLAPELMPAALLVPALALPLLQLVARRPRHRLATARLGARGAHPVHPGGGRGRGLVLPAGDRRPRRACSSCVTVALSVRALDLRATPRNAAVAGAVSGFSGTAAAIGGPFLALVLQHERPQRVRSTLAVFFVAGSLLGPRRAVLGGELTREQLVAGLVWVPFGLLGYAVGGPGAGPDRPRAVPACGARLLRAGQHHRHRPGARWPSLAGVPTPSRPRRPAADRLRRPHRRRAAPADRARSGGSTSPSPRRSSAGPGAPGTGRGPT